MLARPSKYWDIPPRGFEHISPLQFKAMQGTYTGHVCVGEGVGGLQVQRKSGRGLVFLAVSQILGKLGLFWRTNQLGFGLLIVHSST